MAHLIRGEKSNGVTQKHLAIKWRGFREEGGYLRYVGVESMLSENMLQSCNTGVVIMNTSIAGS